MRCEIITQINKNQKHPKLESQEDGNKSFRKEAKTKRDIAANEHDR